MAAETRADSDLPLMAILTSASTAVAPCWREFIRQGVAERLAQPFSMYFQVGRGCLQLIVTRQKLSDTRRRLSVQLGPRRWHESAWCLLGFAGVNHADRAGFRHVFSDLHCLFSRYPRLHDTLIQQRVASVSRRLAPTFSPYVLQAQRARRRDVIGGRARLSSLAHLLHKTPRVPQQLRNLAPTRDCFSRIVSVLESICVTLRGARGHPAVHPAAAVRHRR